MSVDRVQALRTFLHPGTPHPPTASPTPAAFSLHPPPSQFPPTSQPFLLGTQLVPHLVMLVAANRAWQTKMVPGTASSLGQPGPWW
jgi:hypothetical protein